MKMFWRWNPNPFLLLMQSIVSSCFSCPSGSETGARVGRKWYKKVSSLIVPTVPSAYGAESASANVDGSMKLAFLKTQF